jgi:hypothetical protein
MVREELAVFLEEPVMMVVSACDAAHTPSIARALGARFQPEGGLVEIAVSRAQWPEVVRNAVPGSPIALTFCRPSDYRSYQVKGLVEAAGPASRDEQARAALYRDEMAAVLMGLGVERHQIDHWLPAGDLVTIRFRAEDAFAQTPGPDAGARLPMEPAGKPAREPA